MLSKKIIPLMLLSFALLTQATALESNAAFFNHWLKQKALQKNLTANSFLLWSYEHIFKDRPYQLSALGEGKSSHFAQQPKIRHDAYDCMTLAITVLAFYHAEDYASLLKLMEKLNYKDKVHYLQRRHFPSTDWNPFLIQQGFVKDITRSIHLPTAPVSVTIDRPGWYKKTVLPKFLRKKSAMTIAERQEWQKLSSVLKQESATLSMIPLAVFFHGDRIDRDRLNQLPAGTLVEFIRPHWPQLKQKLGSKMLASHMGFILNLGSQKMLLHASSIKGKVSLQDLASYLQFLHKHDSSKGLHLLTML
jgi:hypothetical protein